MWRYLVLVSKLWMDFSSLMTSWLPTETFWFGQPDFEPSLVFFWAHAAIKNHRRLWWSGPSDRINFSVPLKASFIHQDVFSCQGIGPIASDAAVDEPAPSQQLPQKVGVSTGKTLRSLNKFPPTAKTNTGRTEVPEASSSSLCSSLRLQHRRSYSVRFSPIVEDCWRLPLYRAKYWFFMGKI